MIEIVQSFEDNTCKLSDNDKVLRDQMHNVIKFIKTIEDARSASTVKQSKEMLNEMLYTKMMSKATEDLT